MRSILLFVLGTGLGFTAGHFADFRTPLPMPTPIAVKMLPPRTIQGEVFVTVKAGNSIKLAGAVVSVISNADAVALYRANKPSISGQEGVVVLNNALPKPSLVLEADADGRFSLTIRRGERVLVHVFTIREIGYSVERLDWFEWVTDETSSLRFANAKVKTQYLTRKGDGFAPHLLDLPPAPPWISDL